MELTLENQINNTLNELYHEAKKDQFKILKKIAQKTLKKIQPSDLKDVYLSISKKQGEYLQQYIKTYRLKNIVEFGTSFGISTLFLAQGTLETKGQIITTELIPSKGQKAIENFKRAGVHKLIEVRIGNALQTLKDYQKPIDLLLLDGWKDLYLPLFQLLEPNYHKKTMIYVDNANMLETQKFLATIAQNSKYKITPQHNGKAAQITMA
ncbi:O-methyltransferase [Wenyingzhuangia aestuarii]|uniref:O-methyltransferase n=1 Tax=Wenyingzhuangia aestuarii TaxID=1647582 RepID=UPI00143CBD56|nr:class I SAM-dependent methyltransferase [Wenyingzhuangia aestuarii]NJB81920.1 putative O-methyltransferase YrrM [Wenyingzhuangia aestuarii]